MRERDIFVAALDLDDPEDQLAYVSDACGDDMALRERVKRLLGQRTRTRDFILDQVEQGHSDALGGQKPGDVIGRYKLVEKLGEGGFGEVWLGEQEQPVRRTVAIKVIKLGMDTKQVIARFESERQALALMNHPNIATVLDAGSTDAGRPFFVMELVRGVPITDYCDAESLDTRQRLDLFASVCLAVQHAHQRGVIHRDLKPSNILVAVDDGVATVKVIDFGIAKATNAEHSEHTHLTEDQQIIGTPVYMSPEQAEMGNRDIDTRCDVYSLGVLLYELLTGATPFDSAMLREAGYGEMLRIIREDEPKKPSTCMSTLGSLADAAAQRRRCDVRKLGILIRGDLDWIVMRCLEKDRTRRYASAKELSDEIFRHMNDEPVDAGPPSTGYRLQKFVRRNRGAVIATAIVLLTMVAGFVGTSIGLVRALDAQREAEASRKIAEKRAQETALLADFQSKMLEESDPWGFGSRIAAVYAERFGVAYKHSAVDTENLEKGLGDEHNGAVQAFKDQLAMVNPVDVAKIVIGELILAPAAATASRQFAGKPLLEAGIRHAIGRTYATLGLYEEAIGHLRWALDTRQRELRPDSIRIAECAYSLAEVFFNAGKHEEAEGLLRMAKDDCKFSAARKDRELKAEIVASLGTIEAQRGNYDTAEKILREALSAVPAGSSKAPNILSTLAMVCHGRGDFVEAEALLRQAIELRTDPEYLIDQLQDIGSLGVLLGEAGKHDEAEKALRQALNQSQDVLGDEHPNVTVVMINLADILRTQGKLQEAEALFLRALSIIPKTQGNMHPRVATVLNNLAVLLGESGRPKEAEARYREAISIRREIFSESHPSLTKPMIGLAFLLRKQGRFGEAEELLLGLGDEVPTNAPARELRRVARRELATLYDAWHKESPDEGYDAKAKDVRAGD